MTQAVYVEDVNYVRNNENQKIFSYYTEAEKHLEARPLIVWIHGFAEHSMRYLDIIQFFSKAGYSSLAYDCRGHGRSEGKRAYVRDFDDYFNDLDSVLGHYRGELKGRKIFFIGHSMGGLTLSRYLEQLNNPPYDLRAAILSSPFFGVYKEPNIAEKVSSKILSNVYPHIMFPTGLNSNDLSHDLKVVKAYENDPLVFSSTTPAWFESVVRQHELVMSEAHRIKVPLHILFSGCDKIVDPSKTKQFYELLPDNIEKSLTEYDELFHEIFNEVEKDKPYEKAKEILDSYL